MSFLGGMIELLKQIVASLYLLVSLLQGQPEDFKPTLKSLTKPKQPKRII